MNPGAAEVCSLATVVFARGALGGVGGTISDISTFDLHFREGAILHYECPECDHSHLNIWYKRLTPTTGIQSASNLFLKTWASASNQLNEDFALYSSLADLKADVNRWTYCKSITVLFNPHPLSPPYLSTGSTAVWILRRFVERHRECTFHKAAEYLPPWSR